MTDDRCEMETLEDEGEPYVPPEGWTQVRCSSCDGHGLVSPCGECSNCGGNGMVWRTPKGKFAQYPGGPFCG